ncbi:MAG: hypothetical protein ABSG32_32890, partial [Terriglobia bacterium]
MRERRVILTHDGIRDPRFVIAHGGDPEFSLITRSSDGAGRAEADSKRHPRVPLHRGYGLVRLHVLGLWTWWSFMLMVTGAFSPDDPRLHGAEKHPTA